MLGHVKSGLVRLGQKRSGLIRLKLVGRFRFDYFLIYHINAGNIRL
jgi:hypothetical protein